MRRRVSCAASSDRHAPPERSRVERKASSMRRARQSQSTGPAEPDRLRPNASASASPALDSSGGDLPPISHNTKAVAEGDDDSENNSAEEIESILAKVHHPLLRCAKNPL